jgi:hypothetical protein
MTTPTETPSNIQVHNAADRDAKNGTIVEIFGTYTEIPAGKDADAPLDGHAAVKLADGSLIFLGPPWHPEAIRPADERALAGQPVVAKGILFTECPPPPDGRAYAKVACLYEGLVVYDRRTYDFMHGGEL